MKIATILLWIKNNFKSTINVFLGLLTALSIAYGIIVHKQNLKLSEDLNKANSNIEAYQEIINDSQQAFGVLQLQVKDLQQSKDPVINKMVETASKNNIKPKEIKTAATQTQTLLVNSKEPTNIYVEKEYNDSIIYNKYTKLYYTIYKDTLSTILDIKNKQDLIVHSKRVYKNKKNFIKRLFTLDFKKVNQVSYTIINSNDLIKEDSIRVIQID